MPNADFLKAFNDCDCFKAFSNSWYVHLNKDLNPAENPKIHSNFSSHLKFEYALQPSLFSSQVEGSLDHFPGPVPAFFFLHISSFGLQACLFLQVLYSLIFRSFLYVLPFLLNSCSSYYPKLFRGIGRWRTKKLYLSVSSFQLEIFSSGKSLWRSWSCCRAFWDWQAWLDQVILGHWYCLHCHQLQASTLLEKGLLIYDLRCVRLWNRLFLLSLSTMSFQLLLA